MIKIKINDTIVDIVEKIESQKSGDIILDFPLGHPILHSYISLKILKSKVGDKKLIIATSDQIGKRIGKRLGIEYSHIKDSSFIEKGSSKDSILQHNFTFWEYFKFQIRSYFREVQSYIQTNKNIHTLTKYSHIYQEKISVHVFLGILIFSFLLFIFVYYFAINKTYVYITPEITVRKEAHNFIFKEDIENSILGNNKNIKIDVFSKEVQLQEIYASTGIQNNQYDISSGKVRLHNEFEEKMSLVPNTRLQTQDGIVFELQDWVEIPAGVQDNFGKIAPGTIEVEVNARIRDELGKFTGSRGNIRNGIKLFLPGLPEETRNFIYAESVEKFSGGRDDYDKVITEEDIQNAENIFEQKLKTDSLRALRGEVNSYNNQNGSQLDILPGSESIYYSGLRIENIGNFEPGNEQENFSLSGSVIAHAYVYNTESVIQKLKTLISERRLEGVEKISHIDFNSLRMSEMISLQKSPFEMKATFEIEALFLHDFLHNENTYISTLRSRIRGINKEDAEKILLNDPKISNVTIRIRPFFVDAVSNIFNNIIFEVES